MFENLNINPPILTKLFAFNTKLNIFQIQTDLNDFMKPIYLFLNYHPKNISFTKLILNNSFQNKKILKE